MKILVAEDEADLALAMVKCLRPWGESVVALDGQETMDLWREALDNSVPFDLIFLNIMMPKKTGYRVLEEVREIEKNHGIGGKSMVPIVMTTAFDDEKNVMYSFLRGLCQGYLIKPISCQMVKEELLKLELITD